MNAAKAVRVVGLTLVAAVAAFAQAPQGAAPAATTAQGNGAGQGSVGEAPAGLVRPNPDRSGPAGTWYIDANDARATIVIAAGADAKTFTGTLTDAAGSETPVDTITWDSAARRIEFRTHDTNETWYWCRATIVEGILVGRFAKNDQSSDKPTHMEDYKFHVTGWN